MVAAVSNVLEKIVPFTASFHELHYLYVYTELLRKIRQIIFESL